MYTYNYALRFDELLGKEIVNFSKKFTQGIDELFCLDGNSIPHATIVKFQLDNEIDDELISKVAQNSPKTIPVNFYGLTFLPSKNGGIWVEISFLKNDALLALQDNIVRVLKNAKIKNKVGDLYRPHITIGKITNDNLIKTIRLDYNLLRRKQVLAIPSLGSSGSDFEFFSLAK